MYTSPLLYWLSHFLLDLFIFVQYILHVFIIYGLGTADFWHLLNLADVYVAILVWASGLILLSYFISNLVETPFVAFFLASTVYLFFAHVLTTCCNWWFNSLAHLHPNAILENGLMSTCSLPRSVSNYLYLLYLLLFNVIMAVCLFLSESRRLRRMFRKSPRMTDDIRVEPHYSVAEEEISAKSDGNIRSPLCLLGADRKATLLLTGRPGGLRLALVGPIGSGKTQLLKGIVGQASFNGDIRVGGIPSTDGLKYLRRIGYCPKVSNFPDHLTGQELYHIFVRLKRSELDDERKFFQACDIQGLEQVRYRNLPRAARCRLRVALSFISHPTLVLLDHVTRGLDKQGRRGVYKMWRGMQEERQGVLFTTNRVMETEHADRMAVMVGGRIIFVGDPESLADMYKTNYLVTLYLKDMSPLSVDEDGLFHAMNIMFKGTAHLLQSLNGSLHFKLHTPFLSLLDVHTKLEALKDRSIFIKGFSARSPTLEEAYQMLLKK